MAFPSQAHPAWQGVNHIALVTLDLDATIHLYQEVLGLRLLANLPASDLHGRHCLLWPGGSGLGLHFFEQVDAQIFTHPDALSALRFVPGALQHVSLTLPDAEAGQALWERLNAQDIQTPGSWSRGRSTTSSSSTTTASRWKSPGSNLALLHPHWAQSNKANTTWEMPHQCLRAHH